MGERASSSSSTSILEYDDDAGWSGRMVELVAEDESVEVDCSCSSSSSRTMRISCTESSKAASSSSSLLVVDVVVVATCDDACSAFVISGKVKSKASSPTVALETIMSSCHCCDMAMSGTSSATDAVEDV